MDAKTRVPHTLCVELLEGRFVLSGADSVAGVAFGPLLPAPPDSDHPRTVRVAAPPSSIVANPLPSIVQYRNDHDKDDSPPPAAPALTSRAGGADAGVRAQLSSSYTTDRDSGAREDAEPGFLLQIARASPPPERSVIVPSNPANLSVAVGAARAYDPDVTARVVGEPADAIVARGSSGGGETSGFVALANSPAPAECDRVPLERADSAAPVTVPGASATPADSSPPDWREVLLDPLAGIPVRETAALNFAALGAETEALLAHLADLRPEWSVGVEWSDCVCFAAGVFLVGGGAYFARSASRTGSRARAFLEPPEGTT